MKKVFKQSLAVFLVAIMIFGAATLTSFVDCELHNYGKIKKLATSVSDFFDGLALKAEAATSGKCGDNLTWFLNTSTGKLTISGSGNMYNWSINSNSPWYDSRESIKTVVIDNEVKNIGNYAFYNNYNLTNITMSNKLKSIGKNAFAHCYNLATISIPDSVTSVEDSAFYFCYNLKNAKIGNGVTNIGENAFALCNSLTNIKIPYNVTNYQGAFYACESLKKVIISGGVTNIDSGAFEECTNLKEIEIPDSVKNIGDYAFYECVSLTDIYYSGTETQWNRVIINDENDSLFFATIHYNYVAKELFYNLGEETYSFENFGDADSPGGHCFGMSVTSSAYYMKEIDIASVGGNYEQGVYALRPTDSVKYPICYYQDIQDSRRDKSMVAGGSYYKNSRSDITSDWTEVVNYIKNHNYDNKGTLQIGFRKEGQGGHAINFLYYAEVNGQPRIYAYDNNFPNVETYFYMDSNGNVMQAPKSTFSGAIDCIALRSVPKYFDLLEGFDTTRYIYADKDTISIEGTTVYALEGGVEMGERVMYEVPATVNQVTITPLVDNAKFEYLDEEYSFGNINEETVGILTLASSNDEGDGSLSDFTIENESKTLWDYIVDFFMMILGWFLLPFSWML